MGRPSGIATTMTVTAMMNALTNTSIVSVSNKGSPAVSLMIASLIIIRSPIKIAIMYPKSPILLAKSLSCFLRGVISASAWSPLAFSSCLFDPSKVFGPTAQTSM